MFERYIQDRKRLTAMRKNYLSPYLEKIAERYYTDGHSVSHVQQQLRWAFRFARWLEAAHVPSDRITKKHADEFFRWIAFQSPEKFRWKKRCAHTAVHHVLRLIWAEHPPVVTRSPSQMEVDRYADHLCRDRGLAEGTVEWQRRYLEPFLTFCFRRRPFEPSAITAKHIYTYVDTLPHGRSNDVRFRLCLKT